ncbi:MAG: HAD-IA family hydrolase [Chthoniobacterales bacterium]
MKRLAKWVLRGGKKAAVETLAIFRPRVIIFDFDGTLGDTFQVGIEILNQLADEFKFRRLQPEEIEKARNMTTRQLISFLKVPTTKIARVSKRGIEVLQSRIDSIQPLPDVVPMIRELKSRGFILGIITSNAEKNVSYFLKRFDLECFDFVRCSSRLFGKAREIRSVIKANKYLKNEILFVGDETRDIEASKKAGIQIAAVKWGYNSVAALEAMKPEYMLSHPQELIALLESFKAE